MPGPVPNGPLRIDLNNSITSGLIGCWVPGSTLGTDLTGNCNLLPLSAGPIYRSTSEGVGVLSNATNTSLVGPGAFGAANVPTLYTAGQLFTLYYRAIETGTVSSNNPRMIGIDNSIAPSKLFGVYINGTGAAGTGVGYSTGGAEKDVVNSATSVLTNRAVCSQGSTINLAGNIIGYKDGAATTTTAVTGGTSFSRAGVTQFGLNGSGSDNTDFTNMIVLLGCYWNRVLSPTEMATMNTNPYDFLLPNIQPQGRGCC